MCAKKQFLQKTEMPLSMPSNLRNLEEIFLINLKAGDKEGLKLSSCRIAEAIRSMDETAQPNVLKYFSELVDKHIVIEKATKMIMGESISVVRGLDKIHEHYKGDEIYLLDALASISKKRPQKTDAGRVAVAAFCKLIEECEIVRRDNLSNEQYCKKVCEKYNLDYVDKVRQDFGGKYTNKHTEEVKTLILPNIPDEDRCKIDEYLDRKYPSTKKLYA